MPHSNSKSTLFPYTTLFRSEMLAKFDREHWHDEDEVRFIISGSGLFHIHGQGREVVAIEVKAGDRKSTRLNSSHLVISYAVFCLKKKMKNNWNMSCGNQYYT